MNLINYTFSKTFQSTKLKLRRKSLMSFVLLNDFDLATKSQICFFVFTKIPLKTNSHQNKSNNLNLNIYKNKKNALYNLSIISIKLCFISITIL